MHFLMLAMLQKPNSPQNYQEPSNSENIETIYAYEAG
jgi:hypothetical protein